MRRPSIRVAKLMQPDSQLLGKLRELPIEEVAPLFNIEMRRGKAMCPFGHDRLSPSFTIGKNKTSWKCYGCGEHGDAISLVQKILGLDFKGACGWLAGQFALGSHNPSFRHTRSQRLPSKFLKDSTPDLSSQTAADPAVYSWLIEHCGPVSDPKGVDYLLNHGIPGKVANSFGVVELNDPVRAYRELEKNWGQERIQKAGLSGNRKSLLWSGYSVLFPFHDDNIVEYVQVRCLQGDRKFIGPKGVLKPIFNRARLKQLEWGQLLHICEGVPDTIALEASGLSAIGILGATSFRVEWVEELLPFDLVGVPDADSGGRKFGESLASAFEKRGKSIRFVYPPEDMDASDVISKVLNAKLY